MRLVFSNYDSPANPYYAGGGARAIHAIATRLAGANRHEVEVVTGSHPSAVDGKVDGVLYRHIGFRKAGPKIGQLLYQAALPWALLRRQRNRGQSFDIWVESLTPPFSTAFLPWFSRKPVIALTQVMAGRAMRQKYGLPFDIVERFGLGQYPHGIALSGHLRRELLATNPRMCVRVIPNGVDGEIVRAPVAGTGREHILFLGRLDQEQKGLDLLLDALAAAGDELRTPIVIAGGGSADEVNWVHARAKALGLGERVRFPGRVEGEAKSRLFREARFMVMSSRFEASPLVLAEAFAYALPVVLFGIPELAELSLDCTVQVPPFDVVRLGAAIRDLDRDENRRERMGSAAKVFARRFDWDDLARQYEDFFESILRSR